MTYLRYCHDPPDITEPWQIQSQYPIVRVDGDIQQALKFDLLTKFVPCGEYMSKTGQQVGFYRWMQSVLSVPLYVSKDKQTVYSPNHRLFEDIFRLFLAGANRVFFVWEFCSARSQKPVIFQVACNHAKAVYRSFRGLSNTDPQNTILVPARQLRRKDSKTTKGAPNHTWLHRTMHSQELSDPQGYSARMLARTLHHTNPHEILHPRWSLAPLL